MLKLFISCQLLHALKVHEERCPGLTSSGQGAQGFRATLVSLRTDVGISAPVQFSNECLKLLVFF